MLRLLLDFVKLNFIELHAETLQCFFFLSKFMDLIFHPCNLLKPMCMVAWWCMYIWVWLCAMCIACSMQHNVESNCVQFHKIKCDRLVESSWERNDFSVHKLWAEWWNDGMKEASKITEDIQAGSCNRNVNLKQLK